MAAAGGFPGAAAGAPSRAARFRIGGARSPGGAPIAGGAGGAQSVTSSLVKRLESVKGYRWVAATDGLQSAASLELATGGQPVMAIGAFNSAGGHLTLTQFEQYVQRGEIRYYIVSGGPGGAGGSSTSSITSWVEAHVKSETVGGQAVYDLTQATGS